MTINPKGYLTTQEGQYIVGHGATPSGTAPNITYSPNSTDGYINVPPGSTDIAIGQDGSVSYVDQNRVLCDLPAARDRRLPDAGDVPQRGGPDPHGRLAVDRVRRVRHPLRRARRTRGLRHRRSRATLEMSNVDMATEFTNMIQAERGYQANSSVISTADQMLQTLVQLRA